MQNNSGSSPPNTRGARYVAWLLAHRTAIHVVAVTLTIVGALLASRLYLKPSFSALLPQDLPSVVQLDKVMTEVGGTGLLLVGIESPSFRANRDFADKLAGELDKLPPGSIRDYEFHFKEARDYFERFGLYYLKTEDLAKLRNRLEIEIKEKAEKKKDEAFSSFLGLDDDEAQKTADAKAEEAKGPDSTQANELTEKLDPRVRAILDYPGDYLAGGDGKLVVVAIRTATSSLSVGEAQVLTRKVRSLVDGLQPAGFHPDMHVNFAGNVQRSIDEVNTVRDDIVDTAVLLVILILVCIYLFFQSWMLVALVVINLLFALAWTMGFTQIAIGYLNTLTAFMSSLVVGTGINYACIFISRYLEERRAGRFGQNAVTIALANTCLPTLAGSATTAISFIALFAANNRGFSDFALIGGVGILLCWIATFTLLPIWVVALDPRIKKIDGRNAQRLGDLFARIGEFGVRRPRALGLALVLLAVASAGAAYFYLQNPFEYDFRKLGNKVSANRTGAAGLHKRIQDDVYKSSLTPAIVLLENERQGEFFCSEVKRKVDALPPEKRNFQGCLSLRDVLPASGALEDETPYKAKLRGEVQALMGNKWLKYSDSKLAEIMLNINKKGSDRPPTVGDVPLQLKRRFQTKDGRDGRVAYVYSDNSKPLEDGNNLLAYTETFGNIAIPEAGTAHAAGENFVIADLLRSIRVDGPKTSLLALGGVLLVSFLLAGGLRGGAIMATCLIAATIWLFGLQALLDVKFNFFNFIALPLTFGIGVDYPINIYTRYKELGAKAFPEALRSTGVAVVLCCSTTVIGYLTLFEASNQALVSFAKLALIGEFTCLTATFLALPVILHYLTPKKSTA